MTQHTASIADVKAALQLRALELARELCPGGSVDRGVYKPLNPTRNDRSPGSFCIWISGAAAGAFKDYATDDKGDVLDLVGYVLGVDTAKALTWARRWTGLERGDPAAIATVRRRALEAQTHQREDEERSRTKRTSQARAIWLEAQKGLIGTAAEIYLRGRGIALPQLIVGKKSALNALRFHPKCWHSPDREFPAIVSCMQTTLPGVAGGIVAIHRTYLAPGGAGKAPVEPPRKMLGPSAAAVIAVWRGRSDMPVREASEHGIADTLVLTEGIEDALSVAVSAPELRVWAVGSVGNLSAIALPPCAQDVIVFADNDWSKPEAEAALAAGVAAIARQVPRVKVARSSVGKDANDLLRGAA